MRADFAHQDKAKLSYHVGSEFFVTQSLPLRAGFMRDPLTGSNYWSAGVGGIDTGGGVDLGYRHELGGNQGRMILLTLRLMLD